MAGSTFQPPIHLDPSQSAGQQTAFINQNFQTLASELESSSFRIVLSGLSSVSSSGSTVSWTTIPHNLGYAPIVLAYLTNVILSTGTGIITSDGNLPLPTFVNLTLDTIKSTATNSGNPLPVAAWGSFVQAVADTQNLYVVLYNATGSSISPLNVQYYLLQQASS